MKKTNTIQAKFLFLLKRVYGQFPASGTLHIALRRKNKGVASKQYQFSPQLHEVSTRELVEFPTTVDQDADTLSYKSKTLTMELCLTNGEGKQIKNSAEIQLTEFMCSESLSRTQPLKFNSVTLTIEYECKATFHSEEPAAKFKTYTQLEAPSNLKEGQDKGTSSKQLAFIPKRKQKTMLLIPEEPSKEAQQSVQAAPTVNTPPSAKRKANKCVTYAEFQSTPNSKFGFSFGPANQKQKGERNQDEIDPTNEEQNRKRSEREKSKDLSVDRKKNTGETSNKLTYGSVSQKILPADSSTSIEVHIDQNRKQNVRKLKDEVKQLQRQNKVLEEANRKLVKQVSDLEFKVKEYEVGEVSSEDSRKKLIQKLHQQLDNKSKAIKQTEVQMSKIVSKLSQQESLVYELRKQVNEVTLEKQRLAMEIRIKGGAPSGKQNKAYQKQIQQLRKDYEDEIRQLKSKLKKAESSVVTESTVQSPHNNQLCQSSQCEREKRDLRAKIKQTTKTIQQRERQLQTKDRLIKNYQEVSKQRERQSSSISLGRQMERWKVQRMMLQQQIRQLKNSKSEDKGNDQLLLTYKLEKQALKKQLQSNKRTLSQISRDKEALQSSSRELQDVVIKTKQRLADVLNGVHQKGGMELYDAICKLIE